MKKLFIIILYFFSTYLNAQENKNIAIEQYKKPNWSVLLSRLDTTQIKSGILIDKVTSFANLLFYNTDKHYVSDKDHFIQAMSELRRASNKTKFIDVTNLKNIITNNTKENQVLVYRTNIIYDSS